MKGGWAMVTGAAGGLGRAMAEALRDAGARVVVVGKSERVLAVADEGYLPLRGDLVETGEPENVVCEAIKMLGRLDILISAHGVVSRALAEEFPVNEWNRTVATNLTSVVQTAQG